MWLPWLLYLPLGEFIPCNFQLSVCKLHTATSANTQKPQLQLVQTTQTSVCIQRVLAYIWQICGSGNLTWMVYFTVPCLEARLVSSAPIWISTAAPQQSRGARPQRSRKHIFVGCFPRVLQNLFNDCFSVVRF